MATNKAAAILTPLNALPDAVAEVEDAATILARTGPKDDGEQEVPDTDDEGKAKFGTAEGIITGVLASLVFGPLGGAVIGAAQGWLTKRTEQGILDTLEGEKNAITGAAGVLGDRLQAMKDANVDNPANMRQILGFEAGLDMVGELTSTAGTRDAAMQMMNKVDSSMTQFEIANETQEIQAGVQDRAETRELGLDMKNQVTEMRGRFDPISNSFSDLTVLRNKAVAALSADNFSYADSHTGVVAYFKTGDPDSAVLGPEFAVGANFGDMVTQGLSTWNSLESQKAMTVDQRNNMIRTIDRSYAIAVERQRQHENKFSDELADGGFPEHYYNDFKAIERNPQMEFKPIPAEKPIRIIERTQQLGVALEDAREVVHDGVNKVWEIGGDFFNAGGEMIQKFDAAADEMLKGFLPTND